MSAASVPMWTKRRTPASRQPRRTFSVPVTFPRTNSSRGPHSRTAAAAWKATPQPSAPARIAATSSRSPRTGSAPSSLRRFADPSERASARTRRPSFRRRCTSAPPMNPEPPVTKTVWELSTGSNPTPLLPIRKPMSLGSETVAPAGERAIPGLTPPTPHSGAKPRIGDVIVALGYADRDMVDRAVETSHETKRPTGQILIEQKTIDSRQLAHALADRSGLDFVDLDNYSVDMGAANLIDMSAAKRFRSVPIAFLDQDRLLVATADPANVLAVDDIAMKTGYEVRMAVASPQDIEALVGQLSRLDQSVSEIEEETEDEAQVIELRESADDAPVVKLVHSIVAEAVNRGASDIHFDPRGGDMRVRFRVDGVVSDSMTVPRALVPGLVSRVKIMAELDISERRVPQDGRVGFTVENRKVDIRVATLPVVRGEAVVMRILDKGRMVMQLEKLGMHVDDRDRFQHAIRGSHGGVLVTGPTGSGKTTSLYAALHEVNTPDKTIITIENPVEYELEGVKQVQVNVRTGLTFAAGLRSMVRSDPDVIMVGEIRDKETAQIAI